MKTQYIYFPLTVAASGSDDDADYFLPIPPDGAPYDVVSAVFMPRLAYTASDTNFWTVALKATDGEAGTPGSSMGGFQTTATGGISLAAGDKVPITIATANAHVAAGGGIQIDVNEDGTASANLDGVLCLGIRKRYPAP